MDNKSAGKAARTPKSILKRRDSESFSERITNEVSADLFASAVDIRDETDENSHSVSTQASSSERMKRSSNGSWTNGAGSSLANCPSNQENVPLFVLNRASEQMLKMIDKLNDKIDGNVADVTKLVAEYCDRTRDLERRMNFMEDEQERMKSEIAAVAEDHKSTGGAIAMLAQVIPQEGVAHAARVARRDPRPCRYCGKVLSVPYVYQHQKKAHQK